MFHIAAAVAAMRDGTNKVTSQSDGSDVSLWCIGNLEGIHMHGVGQVLRKGSRRPYALTSG